MAGARTTKARSAHAAPVDHVGTHSPLDSAEYRYNVRLGDPHSDSRNRMNARVLPSTRRPVLARRGSVQRIVKKARCARAFHADLELSIWLLNVSGHLGSWHRLLAAFPKLT